MIPSENVSALTLFPLAGPLCETPCLELERLGGPLQPIPTIDKVDCSTRHLELVETLTPLNGHQQRRLGIAESRLSQVLNLPSLAPESEGTMERLRHLQLKPRLSSLFGKVPCLLNRG